INVKISMWESLAILGQRDLLQTAMAKWSGSNGPPNQQEKVLTNTTQPEGNHGEQGKNLRPPPFYVSLVIGDQLVYNFMIDSGASSY
ncbi:hypothetical protein KI387_017741, partial [Taxus chinensis]